MNGNPRLAAFALACLLMPGMAQAADAIASKLAPTEPATVGGSLLPTIASKLAPTEPANVGGSLLPTIASKLAPTEIGLAFGRGLDVNLPDLPGKLASGNLPWDDSRFVGLYASREGRTLGQASALLDRTWFRNVRQGITGSLLKHRGLQSNWEAGLAYTLATPALRLGPVATSLKVGAGISHAFSRPSYEDGPFAEPDRRYRTQFLLLVENHWRLADSDRWSLVLRVHHRSGVYGLIAPRNVGSNFLAVGVERRGK